MHPSASCSAEPLAAGRITGFVLGLDLTTGVAVKPEDAAGTVLDRARRSETGEGVISTAIAVLIMALIGAAMWLVFSEVFDGASDNIRDEVGRIGEP